MKAIVHSKYGPPEELQLKEVEKPSPGNHDVLIKVHATSVTSTDCNMRNFTFVPKLFLLPTRMQFGFKEPMDQIAKAFRYVEKGHKRGNVVITVAQSK